MFEPVRFVVLVTLSSRDKKVKNISKIFIQIVQSLESDKYNATKNDLKPKKTYQWMLWISMVTNRIGLLKLWCFVMWNASILRDFYYKKFTEIGAKPAFSIWHLT